MRRWGTGKGEEEGKWRKEGEEDNVEEGAKEGRGRRRGMTESRGRGGSQCLTHSPTHPAFNVHIYTRCRKEMFHTSSMTFP